MAAPKHAPSEEQSLIVRAARTRDNFDVIAGAGCAKTSTLQMIAYDRPGTPMIYHAFNSSIARDAVQTGKFAGTRCVPRTMHSVAYQTIWRHHEGMRLIKINAKYISGSRAFNRVQLPYTPWVSGYRVAAITGQTLQRFCNSADPEPTIAHAVAAMIQAFGDPSLMRQRRVAERTEEAIVKLAPKIVEIVKGLYSDAIDNLQVNEDIYMKMLERDPGLIRSAYRGVDEIMLDESQDSSPAQTSILEQSGKRLIRVGDRKQGIYAWRGAVDALSSPNGEVFTLSRSYRFPQHIADMAMQAADASPEGGLGFDLVGAGTGRYDATSPLRYGVISRTNMGVINGAMKLRERGDSFSVDRAGDIVSELQSAQKMSQGGRPPMTGPLAPFTTWDEVLREADEGGDGELRRIALLVEEKKVDKVCQIITEAGSCQMGEMPYHLITGHRAKGMEFPCVMVGGGWKTVNELRDDYAKAETRSSEARIEVAQEFHLLYVLMSRAIAKVIGGDRILAPEPEPSPECNG